MKTMSIMKIIKIESCPRICPNCGTEDSIVRIGDDCYCQECSYLF